MAVLGQADVDTGPAVVEQVDPGSRAAAAGGAPAEGRGTEGDRPRLAHQPALDGLRGLAVAAVLLFHLERLDGGFLGVDLFFVLSGFLITSLLVVEHRSRGRIDLARFWSRRARRLLPAVLALLVGVSLLLLAFTPEDQRGRFRGDALATLGYVANWHRMSIDLGYWDLFEQPSPLDHTWSLAIEEQFYVVWPLVAVAVLTVGTRGLGARRRRSPFHSPDPGDGDGDGDGTELGTTVDQALSQPGDGPSSGATAGPAGSWRRAGGRLARRSGDRARALGWIALAGAALSFALLAWTYSPVETDRAYYGTDTRIGATLLGAALALLFTARRPGGSVAVTGGGGPDGGDTGTHPGADRAAADDPNGAGSSGGPRPDRPGASQPLARVARAARAGTSPGRRPRWVEATGALGLGWMGWSVVTVDGLSPWYYRGGLVLFAVATVAVIHAVAGGPAGAGLVGRAVGWAPLRGLGIISYGVYLWHWPVYVYLTPERANVDGWALDGLRVLVTLAVALASFWLVEQPIRRGALRGRVLYGVSGGAVAVTLAAVLLATAGAPSTSTSDADQTALGFGPVPTEGSDNPYLLYPAQIPPDATRVLVVGDSGAYHLGPVLAEEGEEAGFAVASSAPYWCNVAIPEGLIRFDDGEIMDRGNCQAERRAVLRDLVQELRPHAVVYYLANASGPGEMRVDGAWSRDCLPAYDGYLTRALQDDVDLLSAEGARVVFATSPYTNVMDELSDERTDCRNATFARVAASRPGRTAVVDMNAFVAQHRDAGREMFMDLVHLSPDASRLVAHWLFPQLTDLVAPTAVDTPGG